ncbi:MAG: NYN domain-containing protein [Holophagales bacterium]|jgi:hypothetical protein|nr:NYN domain-containing protein [Holophagales bacterium]
MIERVMLFVDADNLLARYQALLREGRVPLKSVVHKPERLLWSLRDETIPLHFNFNVIRATYYVSVAGDEPLLAEVASALRRLPVCPSTDRACLFPRVFRKDAGTQKAKAIDTQLAVDAVSHVLHDNLDVLYLLSGDGDFAPVLDVAIRAGKKTWLGAFSRSINPRLLELADEFIDLDRLYFEPAT